MITVRLTSRGRVTIPAQVRQSLRVTGGDRVEFLEVAPGRYELIAATRPVTALKGMFGKPAKGMTVEQMNAVIAARGAELP